MHVAAYLRYSSDSQRDASLDDQLRNIRAYCTRHGWQDPVVYSDAAISGARVDRDSYRRLLADAHRYDVLLVDDLSRFGRDKDEIGKTVKRLVFAGVRLIGVSDGVDTARKNHKADVGLRGLMSELYLDDLADKTHRGLTGRALSGASAGGLPYGYRVAGVGKRVIDEEQAAIVRRIFAEYVSGKSAREIAAGLNREKVPTARGRTWAMSAIYGDTKRGIGILANPIYVGRQIWNRSHWVKHPDTGRRVRQERPASEWIIREHPDLAIIDTATWDAAQRRIHGTRQPHFGVAKPSGPGRQPKHLLSGILRCHDCGGPMVVVDRYRYGCSTHKDRGDAACASRVRVPRREAEVALLSGIKRDLLSEAAFERMQRFLAVELKSRQPSIDEDRRRLASAQETHTNVMAAILAGIITPSTKAALERAEADVAAAQASLDAAKAFQPSAFLPRAREAWAKAVRTLEDYAANLHDARQALRQLLGDRLTVRNENGELIAEIAGSSDAQINMVAGAGFGLYLTEPVRIPIRVSRE